MLYALMCKDKPGALDLRLSTRPTHVEYLKGLHAAGTLKMAGPLMGVDDKPNGSLVIVEAESLEAARSLADNDPYAKAGLFESVDIRAFNWVFNNPDA